MVPSPESRVRAQYDLALECLTAAQRSAGGWGGEVVWNQMLVSQYVIVCHVVGHPIPEPRKKRIRLALTEGAGTDGGFPMYPGGSSYLFHTTLAYVALRLLGSPEGGTDPVAERALAWIRRHGGVFAIPTWGRVWLSILGLHPWSAVQPILPELWLLPPSAPLHPSRLYCHMRLIYLGISYVYGAKTVAGPSQAIEAIRRELYPEGYDERLFERYRDEIASTDLYEAPSAGVKAAFRAFRGLAQLTPTFLRQRALATAMEHILFEFRSTDYVCLSPVNGALFCLALHTANPSHPELPRALSGLEYWFWEDDQEGLRIVGARSDIWDTSFAIQALCEGPATPRAAQLIHAAAAWLSRAQIQTERMGETEHFRSPSRGGWGFADERHPWPVSDCTAEALEALMRTERHGPPPPDGSPTGTLDLGRKLAAISFILLRRNDDGGFGSYEPRRGSMLLRHFNPAEIYGNCMVEYSYVECTASCVRALAFALRELGPEVPGPLAARTREAIDAGVKFLLSKQRDDGSWLGFWGINVTYGTMFAVGALRAAGVSTSHTALARAGRYLLSIQRPDGGWAEHERGMIENRYVPVPDDEPSNVTQTAWAVLALLECAPTERTAIDRAVALILARQAEDGSWPIERATGVFFNTAVLDYRLFRVIFPTWALARYQATFAQPSQPAATA